MSHGVRAGSPFLSGRSTESILPAVARRPSAWLKLKSLRFLYWAPAPGAGIIQGLGLKSPRQALLAKEGNSNADKERQRRISQEARRISQP